MKCIVSLDLPSLLICADNHQRERERGKERERKRKRERERERETKLKRVEKIAVERGEKKRKKVVKKEIVR